MNNENSSKLIRLERIWSIALAALIGVTGVLYVVAVAHLFFSGGDAPYSRERVGDYLLKIIAPSMLTLVGVIGGGVISVIADRREKKAGARPDPMRLLKINAKLISLEDASEEFRGIVIRERKRRRLTACIASALSALVLAIAVILSVTVLTHTVEGQNGWVVRCMIFVLPAALITAATAYVTERLCQRSAAAELAAVKSIREAGSKAGCTKETSRLTRDILLAVRIGVPLLAVAFIVIGVFNGGMGDVWSKAAAICTECIGLG